MEKIIVKKCSQCPNSFKTKTPDRDLCEDCIIKFVENDQSMSKPVRGVFADILRSAKDGQFSKIFRAEELK